MLAEIVAFTQPRTSTFTAPDKQLISFYTSVSLEVFINFMVSYADADFNFVTSFCVNY